MFKEQSDDDETDIEQQLITPNAAASGQNLLRLQTVSVTPHKVLPLKLSPIISVPELLNLTCTCKSTY